MANRRFTLLDSMILVASLTVGLWMARMLIMGSTALSPGSPKANWYYGASYLVLLGISLGLAAVRLRTPRPTLRRLSRQPGSLAVLAVTFNVALGTAGAALSWVRVWGSFPSPRGYANWIHTWLMSIGGPWHVGFVVALAWTIGGLQGMRWTHPDWVERAGRTSGVLWIMYWQYGVWIWLWPFR
jgi:hypothetical protein